jgi:hypothetical protein
VLGDEPEATDLVLQLSVNLGLTRDGLGLLDAADRAFGLRRTRRESREALARLLAIFDPDAVLTGIYSDLGAAWDIMRADARLRRHNTERPPHGRPRRPGRTAVSGPEHPEVADCLAAIGDRAGA